MLAQQNALRLFDEIDAEFGRRFGRCYGGAIEEYRCADAEFVLITMGSMTGAAKESIDRAREQGMSVGLVKLRLVRPFPADRIAKALSGKKAFGVIDRNVSFGWNTGILYEEIGSAMNRAGLVVPSVPFICGLGGEDVTMAHVDYAIERVAECASGKRFDGTVWLNREVLAV
jgi:pyruvate ferredoxin oxidoreductase alpha subunit/phenylglyoxylate dehydrogenase alpha subunit